MYKFFQQTLLVFFILLITACANLPIPLQPATPQVSLTDFKLVKMGLFEQNYRLRLRIKNPNPFALPIAGMNYQLDINDKKFARGTNNKSIIIPASGEEFVEIDVASSLMGIVEDWQDWKSVFKRRFNYKLSGDVNVREGGQPMPFEYKGDVPLLWGGEGAQESK